MLACACGRKQEAQQPAPTASKLKVVTTVAPITSIVENVGGDKIDVAGIIPEGVNSHTFEPIPSDSKLLAQADLIIFNGLDLETPTLNLAKANLKQGAAILFLGDKTIEQSDYIYDFSFPKRQRPSQSASLVESAVCAALRDARARRAHSRRSEEQIDL